MKKLVVFIIFFIFQINVFSQNPKYPFPKHETYTQNHIKPSGYTQEELDNITTGFYNKWKAKYLKNSCGAGQYFVSFSDGKTCVSEGQGYGMMVIPLMAGYDVNGRMLNRVSVNNFTKEIDISDLVNSCYILKLTDKTGNYFVSKKFVIKD